MMIHLLWLALFLILSTPANHKLVKTKINKQITVSLPKALKPMTEEDLVLRHLSVRQPIGTFTDENREVYFSINQSATQWRSTDVEMAQGFFKSSLFNLYDRVMLMDEGIQEIHHRTYIYFEFESRVNGNYHEPGNQDSIRQYTYIQYLIQKGRTLVITFSCPRHLKEEWQKTAQAIMASVKVK